VAASVITVDGVYYLSYHCTGAHGNASHNYQNGFSTSTAGPLGPWTKNTLQPQLPAGPKGSWDSSVVASLNAVPNPDNSTEWFGWFEGGVLGGPVYGAAWGLGFATSQHGPMGPWTEFGGNPILTGGRTCDESRQNPTDKCHGLYINSMLHGEHTGNKYYMYVDAPINDSDEAPLALWIAERPEGPFKFKAYVLDGGMSKMRVWDSGRYSGGSVVYNDGLFHVMISASSEPSNKVLEAIGWATSKDGIAFTAHKYNPVATIQGGFSTAPKASLSTPWTEAMAEGSVFFEPPFIYVHHTIRWGPDNTSFAPHGR